MKKLLTLVSFFFVVSCNVQDSALTTEESKISLTSPSGIEIAPDVVSLRGMIKANASSAFGEKDFHITKITFTETNSQIASLVEFESTDKEFGSVLLLNGIRKSVANGRVMAAMQGGGVVVDCAGGCDGAGESCRERVIMSGDKVTYECTCAGSCKMTVNQQ